MVQATTPTFVLTIQDEIDLGEAQNVYFSLRQGSYVLQKTGESMTIDGNTVSIYLDQEETLPFKEGVAELQLNWTYQDGSRACSVIKKIEVEENLLKKVIE